MEAQKNFKINIMSFGYKYGLPEETNFLQDVRFLPNPYYDENLKPKSGLDPEVREYVKNTSQSKDYILKLKNFVEFYVLQAISAQKESVTISIGCTGGKHRSVTVAYELFEHLKSIGYNSVK